MSDGIGWAVHMGRNDGGVLLFEAVVGIAFGSDGIG